MFLFEKKNRKAFDPLRRAFAGVALGCTGVSLLLFEKDTLIPSGND
jgi:hypothetical protein